MMTNILHNITHSPRLRSNILSVIAMIGLGMFVLTCVMTHEFPPNNAIGGIGFVLAVAGIFVERQMYENDIRREIKQKLQQALNDMTNDTGADQIIEWAAIQSDWHNIDKYRVLTRSCEYVVTMHKDEAIRAERVTT